MYNLTSYFVSHIFDYMAPIRKLECSNIVIETIVLKEVKGVMDESQRQISYANSCCLVRPPAEKVEHDRPQSPPHVSLIVFKLSFYYILFATNWVLSGDLFFPYFHSIFSFNILHF